MASSSSTSFHFPPLLILLLFSNLLLLSDRASAGQVLLEEGYAVTTVIDGHKTGVNPHSLLPLYGSSGLVVLDSANSAFYTVSLPFSQESTMNRLSGDKVGYSDGALSSAQFNRPRSFAIDFKGNVYVADKNNNVIRKITNSGVKTIAGGYKTIGHEDGPAQNASFSTDFELTFLPQSCSLLISDHGNQLVRQIMLKEEDCSKGAPSGSVMGAAWVWALGLSLSGFLGLIIGVAVRPYIFFLPHEGSRRRCFSETWRHCLTNLEKQAPIRFSGARNGIARSSLYRLLTQLTSIAISQVSLMFRLYSVGGNRTVPEAPMVSLLDSDVVKSGGTTIGSLQYDDQLKELIPFGENRGGAADEVFDLWPQKPLNPEKVDPKSVLDEMIQANVAAFSGSSVSVSGLVKRK